MSYTKRWLEGHCYACRKELTPEQIEKQGDELLRFCSEECEQSRFPGEIDVDEERIH